MTEDKKTFDKALSSVAPSKKNLFLFFGADSFEHDISSLSAKNVYEKLLYDHQEDIWVIGIDRNNRFFLQNPPQIHEKSFVLKTTQELFLTQNGFLQEKNSKDAEKNTLSSDSLSPHSCLEFIPCHCAFSLVHGKYGEDGLLSALFDFYRIPYIGTPTLGSQITFNKSLTKLFLSKQSIPVLPYVILQKHELPSFRSLKDCLFFIKNFTFPVITKPSSGGSSLGVSLSKNEKELKEALEHAFQFDHTVLIEPFQKAIEVECSLIEEKGKLIALPLAAITHENVFYDFQAKYMGTSAPMTIPAALPLLIQNQIADLAKQAFKACQCRHFARLDFFYVPETGALFLNEINSIPGMTSLSAFSHSLEHSGRNIGTFVRNFF